MYVMTLHADQRYFLPVMWWQRMNYKLTSIYRNSPFLGLWRFMFTSFWCFSRTLWNLFLVRMLIIDLTVLEPMSSNSIPNPASLKPVILNPLFDNVLKRYFPQCFLVGIWWVSIFNHDGLRKRDKFPSADNEDWIPWDPLIPLQNAFHAMIFRIQLIFDSGGDFLVDVGSDWWILRLHDWSFKFM